MNTVLALLTSTVTTFGFTQILQESEVRRCYAFSVRAKQCYAFFPECVAKGSRL